MMGVTADTTGQDGTGWDGTGWDGTGCVRTMYVASVYGRPTKPSTVALLPTSWRRFFNACATNGVDCMHASGRARKGDEKNGQER